MEGSTEWKQSLVFFLNGQKVELDNVDPSLSLADYVRNGLSLTATKVGCGQGLCGACTVMLSEYDPTTKKVSHRSVNSCLIPLCHVDHKAVTTLEGLGATRGRKGGHHAIQERFSMAHASQCGFCTPGMVMAFYSLLRAHPDGLTEEQIKENLDGNYCRCTGYRPILDAMKSFAKDHTCKEPSVDESGRTHTHSIGLDGLKLNPLDLTLEPIFPPYLMTHSPSNLHIKSDAVEFYRPTTLKAFIELRQKYPEAIILSGNTRRLVTSASPSPTAFISIASVPELQSVTLTDTGVNIGAAVTIGGVRSSLKEIIQTQPAHKTASFRNIDDHWQWIAGTQVRNLASVGGSLIVGHVWGGQEASDVIPPLVVAGATVTLLSAHGERVLPITQFVKGGNQVDLHPDEVLATIHVPFSKSNEYYYAHKQAGRQTSSASVVTAAGRFLLEESGDDQKFKIKEATLCFGGLAAAKTAPQTEAALVGLKLVDARDQLSKLFELLKQDYPLAPSDGLLKALPKDPQYYPLEASPEYKHSLALGTFLRFYNRLVADALQEHNPFPNYKSVITKGTQKFQNPVEGSSPLHKAQQHHTGDLHTTGEALYTDDVPELKGTLYASLVLSTVAHAKVVSINTLPAEESKGVVAVFTADQVPVNIGEMFGDGELFASKEVQYYGQALGIVVATSKKHADRAAKLVKVEYEELPAIITIQEALSAGSLYPPFPMFEDKVVKGDVEEGFSKSDVIVEGEFEVGGAFHWYMEPQSAYAIPREDGGIIIHGTTQSTGMAQEAIAKTLGIPVKDVSVQVKRLGGSFGGKSTRAHTLLAAAVAGWRLGKPVKLTLDRVTDMLQTGTNAPHLFQYKAGVSKDGKIQAIRVKAYANGGAAMDFSLGMIAETLKHIDNSYLIPHFHGEGRVAKTNIAPTKPYRGAGIPQGIVTGEVIIDHLARKLGMAPHIFREINFYKEGDVSSFGQKMENITVGQTWFECRQNFNFDQKRKEVDLFNASHPFVKRGLAMSPVRYGIGPSGFAAFAKASALVHILSDGTVVCHHGGIEMGQGLQVKLAQICANALDVPLSSVYIPTQNGEVLPHGGMTGGSTTTELIGQAVMNACEQLVKRLEPLKTSEQMKGKTWQELVQAAAHMRINLTAEGWNAPTWQKDQVFMYHSWNSAAVEVELDLLTGAHRILRADLVQDVGKSLNPAIDIGQCEGAFLQGVGWLTIEDLLWDKQGRMDINYDIPMAENLPLEYNVSLLPNTTNPFAIHGAKGIGEPPLCASVAVAMAIKDAIIAARQQAGLPVEDLSFNLPLTPERCRLACGDLDLSKLSRMRQQAPPPSHDEPEKKKEE